MIIISPFSRPLRNNGQNAKNYPYWPELLTKLSAFVGGNIIQIGRDGEQKLTALFKANLPLDALAELLHESEFWMSVDNFLPHLANTVNAKKGVVLWGPSDPIIFGYKHNLNLLKDRKYLRKDQFGIWEDCPYNKEAFMTADEVVKILQTERLL